MSWEKQRVTGITPLRRGKTPKGQEKGGRSSSLAPHTRDPRSSLDIRQGVVRANKISALVISARGNTWTEWEKEM